MTEIKKNLSDWEINQIVNFKAAVIASRGRCVVASVVSVSRSGMSRKIKFAFAAGSEILNFNHILELVGYKLNTDGSITKKGCGMDMIFDTLYGIYYALGLENYSDYACHYATI